MTATLKWLLVILTILIAGAGGWYYYQNYLKKVKEPIVTTPAKKTTTPTQGPTPSTPKGPTIHGPLDPTSIDNIENSLILICSDALSDYYPINYPDHTYSYPPIDIDKIYMGVYNGRLYIKWTLGGAIPDKQETVFNNTIKSVSYNIAVDTNNDIMDGWYGAETHLQFRVGYDDDGDIWVLPWYRTKFIDMSEPEGKFGKTGDGILHSGNGGLGKNYFIISYALSDLLGTVYVGQDIHLQFWSEAESNLLHHFSFDAFPKIGRTGGNNWDKSWTVKVKEIQI
jgi:hypothetical protein